MIELDSLTMHYRMGGTEIPILQGIDLHIQRGERVAVVGPSGCGKTTLLLLLAGLERPAAGSIRFDGAPMESLDADALADLRRDRVGIVFQAFHLVPSLSALDNVALPLQIAGQPGSRERALGLLERVGLADRQAHFPAQLSGGEKQRVALARALVHQPDLMLADEPTGNLDEHTGEAVSDLLFSLNAETNATLVLVTHDMALAHRCDRVLRLHDGRLEEVSARAPSAETPAPAASAPMRAVSG